MSSNPGLEILIKSMLDSAGFKDLQKTLQDAKQKIDETKESAGGFKDKMGELGSEFVKTVGTIVAGREAFNFFKEALQDAIKGEQAMQRFAAANAAVGESSVEAVEKNNRWLESMEHTAGVGKDELVPMYQKLIASSGSVGASQAALQVATGMAARGMGDLSTNVDSLTKFMETGKVRGVGPLQTEIRHLTAAGKSQAEVLTILGQKFGDAGAAINTNAMQVKRAQEDWKQFKENIGQFGLSLVQYLKPALEAVGTVITSVLMGAQKFGGYLGVLAGSALPAIFSAIKAFVTGDFSGAKRMILEGFKDVKSGFAEVEEKASADAEKILSAFHRTADGLIQGAQKVGGELSKWHVKNAAELKNLQDMYKRLLADAEIAGAGEIDTIQKKMAVYKKMIEDDRIGKDAQKEAEKEYDKLLVQTTHIMMTELEKRRAAQKKSAADQLKLDADTMARGRAELAKDDAQKLKLDEKRIKASSKNEIDYYKALVVLYQDDLDNFRGAEDKKLELEEKLADAQMDLDKKVVENKKEGLQAAMSALGGYLSAAFGDSKEAAVAGAIIDTISGVVRAFKDYGYPYDVIVAAIVAATGAANIAKIESTDIGAKGGSGFDDPSNDFAAHIGGQKWARDMIDHFSAGAMTGFNSQVVNNDNKHVINNNQRNEKTTANYNIRMNGLLDSGNQPAMRKFVRTLQVVGTQEAARTPR